MAVIEDVSWELSLPAGFLKTPPEGPTPEWLRRLWPDLGPAHEAVVLSLQRTALRAGAGHLLASAVLPPDLAPGGPGAMLTVGFAPYPALSAELAVQAAYLARVGGRQASTGEPGQRVEVAGLVGMQGHGWVVLAGALPAGPACLDVDLRTLQLPPAADTDAAAVEIELAIGQCFLALPDGESMLVLTLVVLPADDLHLVGALLGECAAGVGTSDTAADAGVESSDGDDPGAQSRPVLLG